MGVKDGGVLGSIWRYRAWQLTSGYLRYIHPVTDQTVLTYGSMSTLGECSLFPTGSGKKSQCNVGHSRCERGTVLHGQLTVVVSIRSLSRRVCRPPRP